MAMNSAAAAAITAVAAKKPSPEEQSENITAISNASPNPNLNPSTRPSRWSDAPPSNDANPTVEPPQKKVKNDVSSVPGAGEGVAGVNETPPGLMYMQIASATSAAPSFAGSLDQATTGFTALQQNTNYQSYGSQYQTLPPVHGSFAPGSAKGTGALFYKTKLCTKFKIGACTFNERCHFAHGVEDLRKPPPLWETMAAAGSGTTGTPGGSFMRPKTRPCRYFAEGNCPYNERCNFLHGNEDPQRMQGPTYGASGPYAPSGMQQSVITPAQPQAYSGVSTYPNGSSVSNSHQYASPNQGYTTATQYANPTTVPSTLPAPYGTQTDYSSSGSVAPNMTPYGSTPATTNQINPYPSAQEGTNGASANYNSWNGPGISSNPTPAYMQTNQQMTNQGYQTASWMHNYAAGAYPKVESSTVMPQYSQDQAQHNQAVSSAPYVQGASQQTMHSDASHYQNTYSGAVYQNQQADYTARYNMAEAWGGQTQ
ncbi:hypothetical protein GOP47_0016767 [Adiantum capillus-veneris]|uniref:C3H1-type domain-containing protein n=1 Tax=Adiantum capillus-veneris TaxID=13818 RepID=A0A9D4ZC09_ADICA|nr:hypothetical protein GOP47_0016767 [Adiantum capillus-veneris]